MRSQSIQQIHSLEKTNKIVKELQNIQKGIDSIKGCIKEFNIDLTEDSTKKNYEELERNIKKMEHFIKIEQEKLEELNQIKINLGI